MTYATEYCVCGGRVEIADPWNSHVRTALDEFRAAHLVCLTRERGVPAYTPTTPDPARLTLGEP